VSQFSASPAADKFKSIRKRATGEIAISSAGGDARKITVMLKE
jgi:hypothetical protein